MKIDTAATPNEFAPFWQIPSGRVLENVLNKRLPHSAILCNMMNYEKIPDCDMNVRWFTLNGTICLDSWIVATFLREENCNEYIISPPSVDGIADAQLLEFKNAITDSTLVNWKHEFVFTAVHPGLAPILKEIVETTLGKEAQNRKRYHFFMDAKEAANLDMSSAIDNVILKPLDIPAGAKFITYNWEHASSKTYEFSVQQISKLPSAGIYVNDDEPVAGVLVKRHGSLGMLYTKPEHRKKGYARIVMKSVMKQMGQLGLHPCSYVDTSNEVSKVFHQKLGFKLNDIADFIFL